jgi:hypothetical protein
MKNRCFIRLCIICFCIVPLVEGYGQDPGEPDTVRFGEWSVDLTGPPPYQGTAVLPVVVFNDEALWGLDIPLTWEGPLYCDSGRFVGERAQYFGPSNVVPENESNLVYAYARAAEPLIPAGDGELIYLYFSVLDTGFVSIDTISLYGWMYLYFVDSLWDEVNPVFFPTELSIQASLAGDVNGDGIVNVGDIIALVNYLYRGGAPPDIPSQADVNGDCLVNVGDVVYLVNYLYRNGPAPVPGCG